MPTNKADAKSGFIRHVAPYLTILGFGVLLTAFLIRVDAFEAIHDFTRAHEDWELDELIVTAFSAPFVIMAMTIVKMRREIDKRQSEERRASQIARHDLLTGLPNRQYFEQELERRISIAKDRDSLVAVMIFDVDGFKRINDLYGYEAGDALLQKISTRIQSAVRMHDVVARLDGDEFALILNLARGADEALRAAEKILFKAARTETVAEAEADITANIGVAIYPRDTEDAIQLLQYAAMAMREAKGNIKEPIAFFDPSLNTEKSAYAKLRKDIRRAIEDETFVPYFQPIISLEDNKLKSFEVLARWEHPERGLLPPGAFISAAEEMSLIDDIFWRILRASCEIAAQWPKSISIAINLSPVQFADDELGEKVLHVLKLTGLSPRQLIIEITETALIADMDAAQKAINFLQKKGIRFALDDFGTGYSSLQYLYQLQFDTIKIDRSFIASYENSQESALIVSSIVALSKSLGLKTTAEGVENLTDIDWLKELGCTFAQGYLFSKPVPAEKASKLVKTYSRRAIKGEMTTD